jgi:hypothetical protein
MNLLIASDDLFLKHVSAFAEDLFTPDKYISDR